MHSHKTLLFATAYLGKQLVYRLFSEKLRLNINITVKVLEILGW